MTTSILSQISGPVGPIEVSTLSCNFNAPFPVRALLVMHPHPLHGGSLNNKVVTTIARAGREADLAVVTFNYRGVGSSHGVWDGGIGELEDTVAVASAMIESGVSELMLAGFSFGASMAASAIPKIRGGYPGIVIVDLIQVAPAVENFPIRSDTLEIVPQLVCVNDDDDVVSPRAIIEYASKARADIITHPTGGHYFHGELVRLKKVILGRWNLLGLV